MLFDRKSLDGLADGSITVAFRCWASPRVKVGTTLRTRVGVVEVTSVELIDAADVTEADARAAGFASPDAATARATKGRDGTLYRIGLRRVGDDPRIALRERGEFTDDERAATSAALARLDRAADEPWTHAYLALIDARPATLAATLAESVGQPRDVFKRRIRRLKELGLTESLDVGYRLSPRGRAWLEAP